MHRILVFACALALLLPMAVQAGKTEPPKQQLDQIKHRIEALTQKLDTTKEAHTEAADALKQSERAISQTNRTLYEITRQQTEKKQTLETLQQQQSGLEQTISRQQQMLAEQMRQQYLNGQQSYLQILLSQQDPDAVSRQVHYFSYVARARAQLIESLRENRQRVASLNQQTAATLAQIEALRSERMSQRQQLESEKKQRKTVMLSLAKQIKAQRGEISKLRRDEKRLSDLVRRLARIVPAQPKRSKPSALGKNEALPTAALDSRNFAALRGKLRLPVRGEIANRYGSTREDSGVSWKGLFIRAAEGSTVKTIASGTVVFADWLRGFGNLLIVDHGGNYMSLYGNNQALLRKVGDEVTAGDDIAAVGNSGGNAESGLYFEMRHQSRPFDPLSWCTLR